LYKDHRDAEPYWNQYLGASGLGEPKPRQHLAFVLWLLYVIQDWFFLLENSGKVRAVALFLNLSCWIFAFEVTDSLYVELKKNVFMRIV